MLMCHCSPALRPIEVCSITASVEWALATLCRLASARPTSISLPGPALTCLPAGVLHCVALLGEQLRAQVGSTAQAQAPSAPTSSSAGRRRLHSSLRPPSSSSATTRSSSSSSSTARQLLASTSSPTAFGCSTKMPISTDSLTWLKDLDPTCKIDLPDPSSGLCKDRKGNQTKAGSMVQAISSASAATCLGAECCVPIEPVDLCIGAPTCLWWTPARRRVALGSSLACRLACSYSRMHCWSCASSSALISVRSSILAAGAKFCGPNLFTGLADGRNFMCKIPPGGATDFSADCKEGAVLGTANETKQVMDNTYLDADLKLCLLAEITKKIPTNPSIWCVSIPCHTEPVY